MEFVSAVSPQSTRCQSLICTLLLSSIFFFDLTENNHFSSEFTLVFKMAAFDSHQMNNWQSRDCKIKGVQRSQDNIKLRNLK